MGKRWGPPPLPSVLQAPQPANTNQSHQGEWETQIRELASSSWAETQHRETGARILKGGLLIREAAPSVSADCDLIQPPASDCCWEAGTCGGSLQQFLGHENRLASEGGRHVCASKAL